LNGSATLRRALVAAQLATRGRLHVAMRRGTPPVDLAGTRVRLIEWLRRAFVAGGGDAAAASYSLVLGWGGPYPEITGYCIPTLLDAGRALGDPSLAALAERAGHWLARTRLPSGAICRKQWTPSNAAPSVFNTGQVIDGWCALAGASTDPVWATLARESGLWLLGEQRADGAWDRSAYNGIPHTYYTRVAAPLASLAVMTGDSRFADSARRQLDWTLRQQDPDGWFRLAGFTADDVPTTHTIGYVIEGLVAAAGLLDAPEYTAAAERAARPMLEAFTRRGFLAGRFDRGWREATDCRCVTGDAQVGAVWARLARLTGDDAYHDGAVRIAEQVRLTIDVRDDLPELSGAIPGSMPRWGDYDPYAYPTHAAKFALDLIALVQP